MDKKAVVARFTNPHEALGHARSNGLEPQIQAMLAAVRSGDEQLLDRAEQDLDKAMAGIGVDFLGRVCARQQLREDGVLGNPSVVVAGPSKWDGSVSAQEAASLRTGPMEGEEFDKGNLMHYVRRSQTLGQAIRTFNAQYPALRQPEQLELVKTLKAQLEAVGVPQHKVDPFANGIIEASLRMAGTGATKRRGGVQNK